MQWETVIGLAKETDDVLGGITTALAQLSTDGVATVVIGTTRFTNAVVQRRDLNRVGFLRIGLPAGRALPPLAAWRYDFRPEPGSPEARLYSDFLRPRAWADWSGEST